MPDAVDDYYTTAKDTVLSVGSTEDVGINDVLCPGGPFTIAAAGAPSHGTVTFTPNAYGEFDYTPDAGFTGIDSFTYSLIFNNSTTVDQATVHITVTDDCSVVASTDSYETPYETPLSVAAPGVLVNDTIQCQPTTVVITGTPPNGTVTDNGDGAFAYTPDAGFTGVDGFAYELRDANQNVLANSVAHVYVEPPTCDAIDDSFTIEMDQSLVVPQPGLLGNDSLCPLFDEIELQPPAHGTIVPGTGGAFDYQPDPGYVGTDSFTYEMYAFLPMLLIPALADTATVTIDVTPAGSSTTTTTSPPDPTDPDPTGSTEPAPTTEPVGSTETPSDSAAPEASEPTGSSEWSVPESSGVRIATFNASLNRPAEGDLIADLSSPDDPQAAAVAEIIQRTRPDIVLLNEFDYDDDHESVDLFRSNYLEVPHGDAEPIEYPYAFTAPVNTGVASGFDLDNDGAVGGPGDALGFGEFAGQYGMVIYSRYPIVIDDVRTFQNLLWSSMPGARLPDDPTTPEPADWYSAEELAALPLSSKSHWDVPIDVDGRTIHVLASHPTPPVFDGDEDRNGTRNADEIRFWADYVSGAGTSWIVDDSGEAGALDPDAEFVVVGDLNSDLVDGDSLDGAIQQLLFSGAVRDPLPTSSGAVEAADQGGANDAHFGDPAHDTADFADDPDEFGPGNLRADYVLPSAGLTVLDAGVFWPPSDDPLADLIAASDHRLVWIDIT